MTERLYYSDSYLTEFQAQVVERSDGGLRIYLDRTAFYPTSGGQPFDTGSIAGAAVVDVIDEGERIAHVLASGVDAAEVACRLNWERRFDHMQQHSGQHLLSGVLLDQFGIDTVSVHFGAEISTIDVVAPPLPAEKVRAIEVRANEVVCENRPVSVITAENSEELGLRKPSGRTGPVRVVIIEGIDRCACGGTHVRATGEIGPVLLRKLDKVRNTQRLEFLCGGRAVRRARADFDSLSRIAQLFSANPDDTPALVASQSESLKAAEKERRRLEDEVSAYAGRELYDQGTRRVVKRLPSGSLESMRALAQSFCSRPKAVFLGVVEKPPAVLLCASEDSGVDCAAVLKSILTEAGGRGGGTARLAQGSAPSPEALEKIVTALSASLAD